MAFKYLLLSGIFAILTIPHCSCSTAVWTGNPFSQFVGHPYKFSSPRVIPHPPIQWVINRQAPFECTSEGWFPDPADCTLFYRCVRLALLNEDYYLVYPFVCPPGTYFDGVTDACYHVDNFTGCGSLPPPPETGEKKN